MEDVEGFFSGNVNTLACIGVVPDNTLIFNLWAQLCCQPIRHNAQILFMFSPNFFIFTFSLTPKTEKIYPTCNIFVNSNRGSQPLVLIGTIFRQSKSRDRDEICKMLAKITTKLSVNFYPVSLRIFVKKRVESSDWLLFLLALRNIRF